MDIESLVAHRREKDRYFALHPGSPLAEKEGFEGLDYYPPDPSLVFHLDMKLGDGDEVRVDTSDERQKVYVRRGHVAFLVAEVPQSLTVYDTGQPGLFIPFRDATCGAETYGGGRYLDLEDDGDGPITIDFNMAYNPYCAYSGGYSCPIPPRENWLSVPIRAGERAYSPGAKSHAT